MPNWKKALAIGSFTAGAIFLFKGNKTVGFILAGVGAAVVASEYPEQMERLWERAPEYLERGTALMGAINRIRERLAEEGPQALHQAWREAASEY